MKDQDRKNFVETKPAKRRQFVGDIHKDKKALKKYLQGKNFINIYNDKGELDDRLIIAKYVDETEVVAKQQVL